MKNTILVVEDNADFYNDLFQTLTAEGYNVLPYTPTYEEAIERIEEEKPDLVLLDIELKGDKSGYDVAAYLNENTGIPFIFLTQFDDSIHFTHSIPLHPESFISKEIYAFDPDTLLRDIAIRLVNSQKGNQSATKDTYKIGILAITDFLDELRLKPVNDTREVKVPYKNIVFITKDLHYIKNHFNKGFKENYLLVETGEGEAYLIKYSLSNLEKKLPSYLVRISEKYIVNILSPKTQFLKKRKYVKINDLVLPVTKTYWREFNKRINDYFDPPKEK